ncbi:MAG: hypothetical protein KAX49_14990 [Halanaerobiales bacterium]|nr:hypothetical protein [Halanaerobiales bacterium]
MNLFEKIPQNLFSILASKNKEIYVHALFTLRKAYKQNMILKKDEFISILIYNLEDLLMDLDEEDIPEDQNLSSMAHFLIRRLESTGWIDKDYIPGTFDEHVIVPGYSLKIINTLYDLVNISEREYNGYVYTTYSALKTADSERNEYMYSTLKTAYENTNNLIDELKGLSNEIKNYSRLLSERSQMKEILADHFDNFKQLVEDRIYYPLKTFDSVPRYKGPIMTILKAWLYDEEIMDILLDSALRMKAFQNKEDGYLEINQMIGQILTAYEKMDDLITQVDSKNTAYIRASFEKIRFLLNTDRSIKGKLIEILKYVQQETPRADDLLEEMKYSAQIFAQKFLDEQSLYIKGKNRVREKTKVLKMNSKVDKELFAKEFEEFQKKVQKSFSHAKIMKFMESQFKDKQEIYSSDLNLKEDDDFIMTILAVLKADEKNSFYRVDFLEGSVMVSDYTIPCLKLSRKR